MFLRLFLCLVCLLACAVSAQAQAVYLVPAPRWQRATPVYSQTYLSPSGVPMRLVCQGGVCQMVAVASAMPSATIVTGPVLASFPTLYEADYLTFRRGPLGRLHVSPIRILTVP